VNFKWNVSGHISVCDIYKHGHKPSGCLIVTDSTDKCLSTLWYSYILIMKANEMHYFSHLFDKVLYTFRTYPLSVIRSISTLYTRNRYLSCWCLLAWSGWNVKNERQIHCDVTNFLLVLTHIWRNFVSTPGQPV